MGSDSGEIRERPLRRVQISRVFYMGQHEVTLGQWDAVMGSNRSALSDCGPDCPVVGVSWQQAREFVRRLNTAEGETRYRLPTEGEWEYAALAGTRGDRYAPELDSIAWYRLNSQGQVYPVGTRRANAFGLHGMLGNVRAWVQDWRGDYPGGTVTDPSGPTEGSSRVFRTGSCQFDASQYRAVARHYHAPSGSFSDLGFRLARTVETQLVSGTPIANGHVDPRQQAKPLEIGTAISGEVEQGNEAD